MSGGRRRWYLIAVLLMISIGYGLSLDVSPSTYSDTIYVNTTVCKDFLINNTGTSTATITIYPSGNISDIVTFNTTYLQIPSGSYDYLKACFTPNAVDEYTGAIELNQSGTLSPILVTIHSITNTTSTTTTTGCGLLPSISQYNIRISQSENMSYVVHIKNTCSVPITSITSTIMNAKPDFAYITGNIPGEIEPGQTVDLTVNIDGSKETTGNHNFYLTVSGFIGNNQTSTNVNFNVYVLPATSSGQPGAVGSPEVNIPTETFVNKSFTISVSGLSPSDFVFIDIEPVGYKLKSVDEGSTYYKANYVFYKDGEYTALVKVYHAGSLYYQTSQKIIVHPPTYQNTSSSGTIAKILWLTRSKIYSNDSIRVEVRTEGGDPVYKAWVKITLPDGNFLSGDTDKDGVIIFRPSDYGYKNGFPEGVAHIDVRKTGFGQDPTSPKTIQIIVNRIPVQILLEPNNPVADSNVTVKLINKNTGEVINYNGVGKYTSKDDSGEITFNNGIGYFIPKYNETYTITVDKNDKIQQATLRVKVSPMIVKNNGPDYSKYLTYGIGGLVLISIIYLIAKRRGNKSSGSFKYRPIGRVSSVKNYTPINEVEPEVVEVVGDNND